MERTFFRCVGGSGNWYCRRAVFTVAVVFIRTDLNDFDTIVVQRCKKIVISVNYRSQTLHIGEIFRCARMNC